MSYAAELLAIQSKLALEFPALYPDVPIVYDNVAADPDTTQEWVKVTVLNGDSNQVSIGQGDANKGLHRQSGVIEIQVFTRLGQGALLARQIADALASIFRNARLSAGILCRSPRLTVRGDVDTHYQVNVSVPYQRDEVYS